MGHEARRNQSAERRRRLEAMGLGRDENNVRRFYQARCICIMQENPEMTLGPSAPIGAKQLGPQETGVTIEGHGRGNTPQEAAHEAIRNMHLRLQAPLATREELAEMAEPRNSQGPEEPAAPDPEQGNTLLSEAEDAVPADEA